jgi:hypothetical protein
MGIRIIILMQRFIYIWIISIGFSVLCISCDSGPDFLNGNGKTVEIDIDLDTFHIISAVDEVDIYITQGPEQKVSLRTRENMVSKIGITVKDEILTFTDNNLFSWLRARGNPELHITVKDLRKIEMYDYVNIYALDTLHLSYLRVYTYGTGEVNLLIDANKISLQSDYITVFNIKGHTNNLSIKSKNDGKFFTSELIANDININHSGSNILEVFPVNSLSGTLTGTGDLVYFNTPHELDVIVKSTGQVYSGSP